MAKEEKKVPEWELRAGGSKVTAWKNTGKDKREFITVQVHKRSYKDGDEWKESDSYMAANLAQLIAVLQSAYARLTVKDVKKNDDVSEDDE